MVSVRPIRTEKDYAAALARIDEIFDAEAGMPQSDELDLLVDLVELYESRHVPMGYPDPIAAIEFRMDQAGLTQRDLIPFIGSRAKVSEVLSGKRPITMTMARALHGHLGIPAEVLLRQPNTEGSPADVDPRRFPLKEMVERGWLPDMEDLAAHAKELIAGLVHRAGGSQLVPAMYRKNDRRRMNAKVNPYALTAWCWQVLAEANADAPQADYRPGVVTADFLRQVAQLSRCEDGPRQAQVLLAAYGIALRVVPHLPRTHLDGAALRSGDGRPVIGLTLRYDRIDNFWFTLLHELVHVGWHLDRDSNEWFVDDLTLRKREGGEEDPKEREADKRAEEALIPQDVWDERLEGEEPSAMDLINIAQTLGVHPATIAGRVRHERGNYRLLSQFVGTGEVRKQFEISQGEER